jgi:type I restriction enzyme M protein
LWILNKNKNAQVRDVGGKKKKYRNRKNEILFMDLRQLGEPFEKKFTQFSEEDIRKVSSTYHEWQLQDIANIPEFCYSAKLEEIEKKDFSLVPSKYIEFVNRDENIVFDEKMQILKSEFEDLLKAEAESKKDLLSVFKELGYEIKF